MPAVIGGVEQKVHPLGRADPDHVASDLRSRIMFDPIIMRQCHFMPMRMQRDAFCSAVKHAQFDAFIWSNHNQRLTGRVGKGTTVEQEIVGFLVGNIIAAIGRLGDQARVAGGLNDIIQRGVNVLVVQVELPVIRLADRGRDRAYSTGPDIERLEPVIRPVVLNHEHSLEPHQNMDMGLDVAVIKHRSGLTRGHFIGAALPW